MVVAVRDLRPDDLDHARASFDEAAREQQALAEGIAAVAITKGFIFGAELEGWQRDLGKRFSGTEHAAG